MTALTVIRRREVIFQHRVDYCLDVGGLWVAGTVVDLRLSRQLVRGVTRLEDVQRATHIALRKLQQSLLPLRRDLHPVTLPLLARAERQSRIETPKARIHAPLCLDVTINPLLDLRDGERREAKARAAALDGGDDLVDVVADDAEADVLRVLLDDAAERGLCRRRHHVGLIEDDELVALGEQRAGLGEVLDLLAHDVDPAVVRRVQLQAGGIVSREWVKGRG